MTSALTRKPRGALDRPEEWDDTKYVYYFGRNHDTEPVLLRPERKKRNPTVLYGRFCEEHFSWICNGPYLRVTAAKAFAWASAGRSEASP